MSDISVVILAGGQSRRLGQNKAFVVVAGQPLIQRVLSVVSALSEDIVIVTNEPAAFQGLPARLVGDVIPGKASLGGIYSGLLAARQEQALVVGCDMPFLSLPLLDYMRSVAAGWDLVIPRYDGLQEPLHAIYHKSCLDTMRQLIAADRLRISELCCGERVRYITREEIARFDPEHLSFFNINTPEDLQRAHRIARQQAGGAEAGGGPAMSDQDQTNDSALLGVTMPWRVQRITEDGAAPEEIRVVLEEPLAVEVNGQQVAVLMRLPGTEKELAVGFCLSEGLISDANAIQLVHHCGRGLPAPGEEEDGLALASRNLVQLTVSPEAYQRRAETEAVRLIRAGCGAASVRAGDLDLPTVTSALQVPAAVLLSLNNAMRKAQGLFHDIGSVHAAALFDAAGELVVLYEDIGRHNAVDKVVGHCVLRRIPLADKIIVSTGRASYEMVSKAVRVGIPIVASVSTPTALAVQVAEQYGCTLVGYMRANRFSVYTHSQRVVV